MGLGAVAIDARVCLRRRRLDARLARGERPDSSSELRRRADQLLSHQIRHRLAASLRSAVAAAQLPPVPFGSRVPLCRREVRACAALIEELASHVAAPGQVSVRGMALVERLLSRGGSPLYTPHPDGALSLDLRHARAALLLQSP